ncbi:TetR/AcrR family transcriptional regulator [Nocardia arthritidis]|uniref:TetR family transcriptional regulator n=1 Tax=Nocardia arthritidis TaxID=228602 RepID=A0A6G9YFU5_9NOCA|nr:TetR/AcrR family transcriptional regulator [Nocardia arthritidis]QIS12091.1 TetR family transcriptional regulator [Nocardia arthritidis]
MGTDDEVDLDGRRLRTLRSREALARAAFELFAERGLDAVAVEDIAVRAGVTRRTFSRHFSSIEAAVLGDIDQDVHLLNETLRARPAYEPPLTAYRNAVHDWLGLAFAGPGDPKLVRRWELFQSFADEPALFAAYHRMRLDAEAEALRILAERLAVDPAVDLRPAAVVATGAALLVAALQAWAAGDDPTTLPALIEGFFETLSELAAEDRCEEARS